MSPRRATHFLLLRQKKVSKEKAPPSLRPLRCAPGQTCVGAVAGCAVELALRCARRSDNHGESDDEACALRRACSPHNRPAAGLPLRTAKGSQTGGRLFFGDFLLAKQKKVTAPPGAHPGTRPWHRHAERLASKSHPRQAQPERTVARQDAISSVAAIAYPISARTQKHPRIQVRSARVSSLSGVISSP